MPRLHFPHQQATAAKGSSRRRRRRIASHQSNLEAKLDDDEEKNVAEATKTIPTEIDKGREEYSSHNNASISSPPLPENADEFTLVTPSPQSMDKVIDKVSMDEGNSKTIGSKICRRRKRMHSVSHIHDINWFSRSHEKASRLLSSAPASFAPQDDSGLVRARILQRSLKLSINSGSVRLSSCAALRVPLYFDIELLLYNNSTVLESSCKSLEWSSNALALCELKHDKDNCKAKSKNKSYHSDGDDDDCADILHNSCPALCREAYFLITLHERQKPFLLRRKNRRHLQPTSLQLYRGNRRARLHLKNNMQQRSATLGQYLQYSISNLGSSGLNLDHQRTLASLIYRMIRAVMDCHACEIIHGDVTLNSFLLNDRDYSVQLIGFGNKGVDARYLNKDELCCYAVDNLGLASSIFLLLTGCEFVSGQEVRISRYLVGSVTFEGIINELTCKHSCTGPLHLNDDLNHFFLPLILDQLIGPSDGVPCVTPELIERSYVTKRITELNGEREVMVQSRKNCSL